MVIAVAKGQPTRGGPRIPQFGWNSVNCEEPRFFVFVAIGVVVAVVVLAVVVVVVVVVVFFGC